MIIISEEHIERIRRNPYNQFWIAICIDFSLSEEFMIEFQHFLDWVAISRFQILSKEFIVQFSDKVSFRSLLINDKISQEIKDYCRMFL